MPWERRGRKEYFYYGVRTNGHLRKLFLGRGTPAKLAADLVAERKAHREVFKEWREAVKPLERQTAALWRVVRLVLEAALAVGGFRRHNRGEWRRKRASRSEPV